MSITATYKIGTNRGRPRIWIDGKRLAEAGFVGGIVFYCHVNYENITCTLVEPPENTLTGSLRERKVTGRLDGKPIIDMSGIDVEIAFPGGKRVKVTFSPGKLVIELEE